MNHKCQEAQVLLAPFSPTDIIPHRAGQQGKRQNLEVPEVAVKLNSRMHKKKPKKNYRSNGKISSKYRWRTILEQINT